MKRTTAILLAMILAFSLCVCSAGAEGTDSAPFLAKEKGFRFVEPHEYDAFPHTFVIRESSPAYTVSGTCKVTKPEITLKPEKDGNVTYVINYTTNPVYTIQYQSSNYNPHWEFATWMEEFLPYDYYSGQNLFPNSDEMNREVSIPYNGENITLKLSRNYDYKWLPYTNANNFTTFQIEGLFNTKMEITAPAEYDGLVLGIQCGEAVSAEKYDVATGEWDADPGEAWNDAENLGNWEFIRVKDFAAFESLKSGNYGSDVRELQQLLKDLGYLSGGVDGDFGPGTAKAVSAFQAAAGLEETGIADDATRRALYGLPAQGEEEEEPAVSEAPEQPEAPTQEPQPEEAAQESQPAEPVNEAAPAPAEAAVNDAAESAEPAESAPDSAPVQEEPAAEEAGTPAEPGEENMGPYGIPLYNSADEVDLATVFAGHGKKRLVDLFGSIKIAGEYNSYDLSGTLVSTQVSDFYYILDNEHWEEPQYVKYIISDQTYSIGEKIGIGNKFLVFNRDLYHGNPYEMCLADSGYVLNKSPVKNLEEQLVNSFLFSSEKYTFNVTKTEQTDGMYLIHFDVLDRNAGGSVTDKDCYVLIDPKTSLVHVESHNYDSTFNGQPTTTELTRKIYYGLETLPDYSPYISKIS